MKRKPSGRSYAKRVADVNAIYDQYVRTGLSNREIWRRFIYPVYGISERSFYNLLKTACAPKMESKEQLMAEGFLFPEYEAEINGLDFFKKHDI